MAKILFLALSHYHGNYFPDLHKAWDVGGGGGGGNVATTSSRVQNFW